MHLYCRVGKLPNTWQRVPESVDPSGSDRGAARALARANMGKLQPSPEPAGEPQVLTARGASAPGHYGGTAAAGSPRPRVGTSAQRTRRGGMVSGYWCVHDTHGALEIAKFSFPKLDFQS
eukprot:SAG31_NODE_14031_length_830_cov_6.573187_1_plen_119_part_10